MADELGKSSSATKLVFGLNPRASARKSNSHQQPKQQSPSNTISKSVDKNDNCNHKSQSELEYIKEITENDQQQQQLLRQQQQMTKDQFKQEQKEEEVKSIIQPRMQFQVPPPKQISTPKSFGISYAKSKIYDRNNRQQVPVTFSSNSNKQANNNQAFNECDTGSTCLAPESQLPAAIVSGYKPPRQVDVSQARARWETSEPYARNRSSRMLAAARQRAQQRAAAVNSSSSSSGSNSSQLSGIASLSLWSAASVVDQKLQLQAALAASAAAPPPSRDKEAAVKLLARGSVLERAQKFEKSNGDNAEGTNATGSAANITSNQLKSSQNDIAKLTCATIEDTRTTGNLSTIQSTKISSISDKSSRQQSDQQYQAIPRFYTPIDKFRPNTYELEKSRQNIIACFAQFPQKQVLLNWSSMSCKRNFQLIATACGLSNYLKDPLFRYVKYTLESGLIDELMLTSRHHSYNQAATRRRNSCLPVPMTNVTLSVINVTNHHQQQVPAGQKSGVGRRQSAANIGISKSLLRAKALSIDSSMSSSATNDTCNEDDDIVDTKGLRQSNNGTVAADIENSVLSCNQFISIWMHVLHSTCDLASKFVYLLTFGKRNYLMPDDFVNLIQSVIDEHIGLKFLRQAPDFHLRYIQTVIARIFFACSKRWTCKLSLLEVQSSHLLQVINLLSTETDIQAINDFFSYEQFYVIYCKFWALDSDHDLYISKADLSKHQNELMNSLILDRIFDGVCSPLVSCVPTITNSNSTSTPTTNCTKLVPNIKSTGKMSYPEFVWFLIAEEDKRQRRSIEYWFRCMDLDGDGYLSLFEMQYFYDQQAKKLESMGIEPLPFRDSICLLLDSIKPRDPNKVSICDIKNSKLSTLFFDTFVNIGKYLEHESSDFGSSTRDLVINGKLVTDFERFCNFEYQNLVASEETSI